MLQEDDKPSNHYLETVKEKLRSMRQCAEMGKNELQELAESLSYKDKFKERYFDPLMRRADVAIRTTVEEADTFVEGNYPNAKTRRDSLRRIQSGYDQVWSLRVELLLFELKDEYLKQELARFFHKYVRTCTYGPFHAALKIGNLVLDWDESSLVIPYVVQSRDIQASSQQNDVMKRTLVFRGDLHVIEPCEENKIDIPTQGGAMATAGAFNEPMNHLLDITEEKVRLLDKLAEVMVFFNNKQSYGVLSNNCQHFVTEVLKALGHQTQADQFQGKIQDFFNVILVKRGMTGPGAEFNTHVELDDYVRENVDTMTHEDLEFCHCHYLLFHAWSTRFNKPAWSCTRDTCQADQVAMKMGL